jgi:hypothetical protein
MSSAAPCATCPSLSSVAGLNVSKVLPLSASTHAPSMSSRPGLRKPWAFWARPSGRSADVSDDAPLAGRFGAEMEMIVS